jgi:Protein of unknown function (DUF1214)
VLAIERALFEGVPNRAIPRLSDGLKRAIIAQQGLGANVPEDAIYPLNLSDEAGRPLDGGNRYTINFDKASLPPVNAFWSITLYDSDGFQVANNLNRFAVSSWMPFKYNADGSLTLYFQNESPGKGNEANWLPAPKGHLQSDDAALRSEIRSTHWQMESAAGHPGPGAYECDGAIKYQPISWCPLPGPRALCSRTVNHAIPE